MFSTIGIFAIFNIIETKKKLIYIIIFALLSLFFLSALVLAGNRMPLIMFVFFLFLFALIYKKKEKIYFFTFALIAFTSLCYTILNSENLLIRATNFKVGIPNPVIIIDELKKDYPNLIISHAENIYPNCWDEARAEGYRLMTGDYMTVIGSDDKMHPEYIQKCIDLVLKAPEKIKVIQSPARGIALKDGKTIETGMIENTYSSTKQLKQELLQRCVVNSPSVFYKASLYHDGLLETFPEKYGGAADYDLYC